jgi:NitT/TauT family transport system ATP-binding protein
MMTPTASPVRLERVAKRFATGVLALQEATLSVQSGEFVSILGPSGCGKSTILRLLAGLETPSSGSVVAPALAGQGADTAFVFQDATLMPWASVFDNVWLPLRLSGKSRQQALPLVNAVLEQVSLLDFSGAYPAELSGGMKMRTSIARALVATPQLLLMDEPFAALDEVTRSRLGADLLRWWAARTLSMVFVTHSVFEAAYLSQRVLVMSARPGRIISEVRVDEPTPREAGFRLTAHYQAVCRELSATLERAQ